MKNTYSIGILSSNLLVQTKDTPLLLLNHNKNNLKAIIISLSRWNFLPKVSQQKKKKNKYYHERNNMLDNKSVK